MSISAKRNRCRILKAAANTLGFMCVDTISDNASPPSCPYRAVIPAIDCCFNALVKIEHETHSVWQYTSGCMESTASLGALTSSNVADGFVAFTATNGDLRYSVRNDAYDVLPFATRRILSNRDTVFKATEQHKHAVSNNGKAHPDHYWIRTHFGWDSKKFDGGSQSLDIEPHGVWGSHESESFVTEWARELGIARSSVIRLRPEVVALSAMEPGKLRVALKSLSQ